MPSAGQGGRAGWLWVLSKLCAAGLHFPAADKLRGQPPREGRLELIPSPPREEAL